jgi:hypothetical protein
MIKGEVRLYEAIAGCYPPEGAGCFSTHGYSYFEVLLWQERWRSEVACPGMIVVSISCC